MAASTRDRLRELVKAEPHINQTAAADRLGVSRQRIQQLATELELTLEKGPRGIGGRNSSGEDAGDGIVVPSGVTPAVAVMLTAADLIQRGYEVFVPVIQGPKSADLVAIDRNNNVERIKIRQGQRDGKEIRYDDKYRGDGTRRALLLTDEPVQYRPALGEKKR